MFAIIWKIIFLILAPLSGKVRPSFFLSMHVDLQENKVWPSRQRTVLSVMVNLKQQSGKQGNYILGWGKQ
jgi:hypothetical protein